MSRPSDILMVTGDTPPQPPTAGKVLLYAKNNGKFYTMDPLGTETAISGGGGATTTIDIIGQSGITVEGSPLNGSGTVTLGLGDISPTGINTSGVITASNIYGLNTGDQTITLSGDVTGTGTSGISATLVNVNSQPGTYGSNSEVPVITTDSKGRITSISTAPITGSAPPGYEMVVFRYTPGSSGTLAAPDAIVSTTSGVQATITDGINSVVSYSFTGKSNLPTSILTYGQIFATNQFRISTPTIQTNTLVNAGGTDQLPDIISGLFSPTNTISIQSRPSDTGASGSIGQRAYLIVLFGF